MPYLSELLNHKVKDSADEVVGRLKDILISSKASEYQPLEFLVIESKESGENILVPYSFVGNFSRRFIFLKTPIKKISTTPEVENAGWVYLKRDVMDEQIVDVEGARLVRVNDLRLNIFKDKMSVVGIDVSTKGLLRRMGLEWLDFRDWLKVNLIDWRHTQPVRGILKLDTAAKNLNRLHPADLANVIEDLNVKAGSQLVVSLDAKSAAKVLEEVDPHLQKVLVKYLGPEKMSSILGQMSTDEIVDLLKTMPKEEARIFLSYIQNQKARKIEKLIKYEDDTAGGLMTSEYIRVKPDWTVREVIAEIKKVSATLRSIVYVYVLGEDDKFLGSVSLRWLLISDPDKNIKELVKTFPISSVLQVDQDVEDVIKVMTKYDLYTAVVLDKEQRMLGVVTIDDVMRHLVPQA